MAWTDEMVESLRQMWVEGLTATEIAKKLGVSKNSIVGKVHRLCLTARPSPIKKKDEEINEQEAKNTPQPVEQPTVVVKATPKAKSVAEPKEVSPKDVDGKTRLVDLDSHTCRWPIGDPRDEDFCFCGKKVRAGQTYCDEHSTMAYVKANRR